MYKFEIEKMGCMSCVHNIQDELHELDKAISLKPDLKNRTLEVNTDIPREKIKQIIEDAGCQVKDIN